MNDLIGRADALEAIKWMPVEDADAKTVQRCIEAVSNLPSAQPTYTDDEIQKMQEIEQAQIEKAYQLGKEDAEPKWIPCSERLPDAGKIVLVCGKMGGIYTAVYNTPVTSWRSGWWKLNSKSHYCDPKAWMPLPKPYGVEK